MGSLCRYREVAKAEETGVKSCRAKPEGTCVKEILAKKKVLWILEQKDIPRLSQEQRKNRFGVIRIY